MIILMFIICYIGTSLPNSYAVVTLFEAIGNCCFDDVSSQKYGEVIIYDRFHVHHPL